MLRQRTIALVGATAAVGASALALNPREPVLAYGNMNGGPPMKKIPSIILKGMSVNGEAPNLPKMMDNDSEKNSQTWLDDLGGSTVKGKEMTCGLFRMNARRVIAAPWG